jgi:hypothetical protein
MAEQGLERMKFDSTETPFFEPQLMRNKFILSPFLEWVKTEQGDGPQPLVRMDGLAPQNTVYLV